ncbi:MAG: hypothetical protein J6Q42_04770 [Clostridia bacterium]|nr:hypothetical protein [Clostridia bacterium]
MSQITPEQLGALLQFAANRLGTTPEQLAETVQSGGLSAVKDKLGADKAQKITDLVGNPQQAEQLLNSPQVQAVLAKLLGGKNTNG